MGGSYYSFPCSILSIGKDHKTPQRYPDVLTTSWRIFIRSMDSFQGLTTKSPSSWHQPLAPKDLALYDNKSWNDPRDWKRIFKKRTKRKPKASNSKHGVEKGKVKSQTKQENTTLGGPKLPKPQVVLQKRKTRVKIAKK
ncbi:hypothetical protein Tco_0192995, partial [Tanacetum coccineum]